MHSAKICPCASPIRTYGLSSMPSLAIVVQSAEVRSVAGSAGLIRVTPLALVAGGPAEQWQGLGGSGGGDQADAGGGQAVERMTDPRIGEAAGLGRGEARGSASGTEPVIAAATTTLRSRNRCIPRRSVAP